MHRDAPSTQIIDSKHTAYNITPHIIKYQYFPDWITIGIEDWVRGDSVASICIGMAVG